MRLKILSMQECVADVEIVDSDATHCNVSKLQSRSRTKTYLVRA